MRQNAGLDFGLGALNFELAGTLCLAWIIVYLIIMKGLHSSGKVSLKWRLCNGSSDVCLAPRSLVLIPGDWLTSLERNENISGELSSTARKKIGLGKF